MDTLGLGKIIEGERHRDAIHVAVAPVTAAERLSPGQHIGLIGGGEMAGVSNSPVGIVDPYLPGPVFKGDRFWLFLYPYTVTSLRHEWEHPAFTERPASQKSESAEWIEGFIRDREIGVSYDQLIAGANAYLDTGEWMSDGCIYGSESIPDEFWDHFEAATGRKVLPESRGTFLHCSC